MNAELVFDAKATLGEGPAWDEKTQTLYWIDILEKKIYAGDEIIAQLDETIGCLAPCKNGHLILGKHGSIVDFEPGSAKETFLTSVSEPATSRFNDGKCDPAGRFLLGSMDMKYKSPIRFLYSYDGKV